jgi:hypothetical protein
MGINISANTKAKASLRLYNHIASYMFEQEYGEMQGNSRVKQVLDEAKKTLAEIIEKK